MNRVRIKFCGMMRPEDAAAASRLGADAIGMIFHPSAKRCITLERAREILAALGPFVTPVGVFVDAPAARIIEVAHALGLRTVQLNGRESAGDVANLGAAGLTVLKAVRVDPTFGQQLSQWRSALGHLRSVLTGLVLETGNTSVAGGTGIANDWSAIRRHLAAGEFEGLPPLIAAGGLTPDSVESVIRDIRPWAVDVSSGIERTHGEKDHALMQAFVQAASSPKPQLSSD